MPLLNKIGLCSKKSEVKRYNQEAFETFISKNGEGCSANIGGLDLTNVRPIYDRDKIGLSKIGIPSFYGFYKKQKVKIYGVLSIEQVKIRQEISQLSKGLYLPNVLGYSDNIIVQEWVDGTLGTRLKKEKRKELCAEIQHFLNSNKRNTPYTIDKNRLFSESDYLLYLYSRTDQFSFLDPIKKFRMYWMEEYQKNKHNTLAQVHHSDLSLENIVLNSVDNRFYLIDNEHLHYGAGWLLDYRNSLLYTLKLRDKYYYKECLPDFTEHCWRLRQIGTKLLNGDTQKALFIAEKFNSRKIK